MGAIIDYNQFVGVIYIDTSVEDIRNDINVNYCPFVEEKILTKLLGRTLYTDFNSNKTAAKYVKLIDGDATAFEYDGVTRIFTGFKKMLAYFTYYYYVCDPSFNTPIGQMATKAQNSEKVLSTIKLNQAWNEGVRLYYEAIDYIYYQNGLVDDTYADFDPDEKLEKINSFGL